MTTQSAREKLRADLSRAILLVMQNRCDESLYACGIMADEVIDEIGDRAISLIAEKLADVTEEMDRAGEAVIPPAWPRRVDLAAAVFRAMLSASVVGKGGK